METVTKVASADGSGAVPLDQPSNAAEPQVADELVVKEECNLPQDEYMDDDELQLVDQHTEDTPSINGTASAAGGHGTAQRQAPKCNGGGTSVLAEPETDGEASKRQQGSAEGANGAAASDAAGGGAANGTDKGKTTEQGEDPSKHIQLMLVDQHTEDDATDGTASAAKAGTEDNGRKDEADKERAKEKEEDPSKHIQTAEEMKRLILTQGQLKRFQMLDIEQFRQAVVGFYVRVNYPGLPSKFATTIFIDQIGDVLEAESFQHLWLKRRLRLRRLGDYSVDRVLPTQNVKNDQDIVSWFSYIEAKEERSPTLGFVHQKEADFARAAKLLEQADAVKRDEKASPPIKKENLMQIALSPTMLRMLAKLDFERFRRTVVGCFVFMPCISKEKPSECQYHIIEVKDVVHGPREYKIYKKGEVQAKIDYQLVFPLYGKYAINWIHTFHKVNEDGFKQWLSDMRQWKEALPTVEHVRDKAAQLQMALSDAEKVPDLEEQERARQREEERAKRAKLPAQNAKDLDACTLSRPQLLKLATLSDRAQFARAITGCFIRLNDGAANHFEIDQIVKVDCPPATAAANATGDEAAAAKKGGDKIVLELKVTGTISLTALTYIVSNFKFTEDEFRKSWLAETTEANPLPTMEMVQHKHEELEEALRAVSGHGTAADAQQKANTAAETSSAASSSVTTETNDKRAGEAAGNDDGDAAAGTVTVIKSSPSTREERQQQQAVKRARNGDDDAAAGDSVEVSNATSQAQGEPGNKGPVAINADGNRITAPTAQVRDGVLTMVDMRRVLISLSKLLDLMTMDKESLVRVLRGFFARIASRRPDKPQALQFYVDQISGVSWGGEPYRFRKVMTDIRLHFRHMGERTLNQLHRSDGLHLTNESFQLFIDDMKKWKQSLPLLAFIDKKVREFTQAQRRSRSSMVGGMAFGSSPPSLASNRRSLGDLRGQQSPVVLPGFEQIHTVIQRQVASSVLATPGLGVSGGGGRSSGGIAPFQSSQPQFQWQQQQQQQHQPFMFGTSGGADGGGGGRGARNSGGGAGAFVSSVGPSLMSSSMGGSGMPSLASPFMQQQPQHLPPPLGKESWRGQQQRQQQLMDMDVQQQHSKYGGGSGDAAFHHRQRGDRAELGGGGGSYEMRRSGGTGYDDYGGGGGTSYGGGGRIDGHGMQQQPLPLGSSLAAAVHYNTALYGNGGGGPTPPKRHRYGSPQPPPVERFF